MREKSAGRSSSGVVGEPIKDWIVSLPDPDARPARKGKLGRPNEFGYVAQIAEVTEHTRRGAGRLILRAPTRVGNPGGGHAAARHDRGTRSARDLPREIALDGGFNVGPDPPGARRSRPRSGPGVHRRPTQLGSTAPNDACSATESALRDRSVTSTRLLPAAIPPQRRRRPTDLDRREHPGLQR